MMKTGYSIFSGKGSVLRSLISGLALGLSVIGCQSIDTTSSGAIGIQREQKMFALLSEKQVNAMAQEAYQDTLKKGEQEKKLNQNDAEVKRLRTIADRLIAQVGTFRADAQKWQWEINLMTDKQLNAYCMPGGKIMFYSGIIEQLKLTDDEIAAIMGHEMAHALREHGREAMSQAYVVKLGRDTLQALLGAKEQDMQLADSLVSYALTLPHSRTKEVEADLMGLELMARAGYDPRAAIRLWKKMAEASKDSSPEFMSTHPSHDTRIAGLEASVHKVDHLYRQARGK